MLAGLPAVARMPEHVHEPYTREDDAFLWANRSCPQSRVRQGRAKQGRVRH